VIAKAHPDVRFRRAIERRALWIAEDAAREPRTRERSAARKALRRVRVAEVREGDGGLEHYLIEGSPRLRHFAEVTANLDGQVPWSSSDPSPFSFSSGSGPE
jgi:hypothetical protein